MKLYLKFALTSLGWIILFTIAAFSDCKNFPMTIKALPDEFIAPALIICAFAIAGIGLLSVLFYFDAAKNSRTATSISRPKAMAFILGFTFFLTTIINLSNEYCR